ncbi:MAG: hypothetical protein LC114_00380 [Bryobacterales bacterium]|nr:hypothetical protein [Bryobacterales bacterium]
MITARGFSPRFRRMLALLSIAALAIVAGAPVPLRALDATPLPSNPHLERLASQSTVAVVSESRQARPLAVEHAALPGDYLAQSPVFGPSAVVTEFDTAPSGRGEGGVGSRAPPFGISS